MRLLPSLRWQYVEFFFEQPVDEGIDVERWTGWAANAETVIDKKAARTFQIKFNAGPAHLEGFVGGWVEQSTRLDGKGLFHRAAISHQIWQTLNPSIAAPLPLFPSKSRESR